MVEVPEEVDNEDLVFPHARIVNMVREKTEEGQYVRKSVYHGLNILLGNIAHDIINELVDTDAAYIKKEDLNRAARKYENTERILQEKERIIKHLRALKDDVDKLADDIDKIEM